MHDNIVLRGVRVHNLKNINLELPKRAIIVITGLSGSGKSSLAFDTIFAEGQRRYMESVSPYAARFVGVREKPDVDLIEGLSPTIAITQQKSGTNPRSTVGTLTEVYDYVRLLFAKVGRPVCKSCLEPTRRYSFETALEYVLRKVATMSVFLLVPIRISEGAMSRHILEELANAGFERVRVDGRVFLLSELIHAIPKKVRQIEVIFPEVFSARLSKTGLRKKLEEAFDLGDGIIIVSFAKTVDEIASIVAEEIMISLQYFCASCHLVREDLVPQDFSFNSPRGACPSCTGLGVKMIFNPNLLIPNKNLSISQGAILPMVKLFPTQKKQQELLKRVAEAMDFSLNVPVKKISEKALSAIWYGDSGGIFVGIVPFLEQKYKETSSDYTRKELEKYMIKTICPQCKGARLREDSLRVTVCGYNMRDIVFSDIASLITLFEKILSRIGKHETDFFEADKKIVDFVVREILSRLRDILQIGLSYLDLNRSVPDLSGGELQRLRLAKQMSSTLSDIVYVLDEPSVGLHARDIEKLIVSIKKLQKNRNTIILVEHDPAIIASAEMVVDIGPRAGEMGGSVVFQGTYNGLIADKVSLTGRYLRGDCHIKRVRKSQSKKQQNLTVVGARAHNLKNFTVSFPLSKFIAVTGVSGSGKSTLVIDILAAALRRFFHRSKVDPLEHDSIDGISALDNVVSIDQSPIGKTPKSNPATYTGIFSLIRDLFVATPEARIKGYRAGVFSFNKEGRCVQCQGDGLVKIEMHFLNDMYVPCEVCGGTRYNKEALEVLYKGRNIAEVLDMSVTRAREFFYDAGAIEHKLKLLCDVGLGYIRLGQAATTLSGGESQRLKIATELSKRSTGKTFYILDEPTTGLHFEDINNLIAILSRLVDRGNTVLVIEHNLDVIKCADWIIDLGPEGGVAGGEIVAQGTPNDIAKNPVSYTGRYLKNVLRN